MSESSSHSEKKATDDSTTPEEQPAPKKLTPLEAIRQAQAARQHNIAGGKRGSNKGQPTGQGGAAASRKPTTGRQSYGGNS